MAIEQRLYTRRLCLLPHPQRDREGGLQLGRLPESARVSGRDALAHRMAENSEASGAVEERRSGRESAPAVSTEAASHVKPLKGFTLPTILRGRSPHLLFICRAARGCARRRLLCSARELAWCFIARGVEPFSGSTCFLFADEKLTILVHDTARS